MGNRRDWFALWMALGLITGGSAARAADNLIYVPLAPCRVIDTRQPGAGGALVAATPRTFFFRGPTRDYATTPNQGGNAAGCGIPDLGTTGANHENIAQAVAINIVAVGPAGPGDLRAWPANLTAPTASVINYTNVTGLNLANGVIVPMCSQISTTPCASGDITFRADVSGTQLVVDVVGYFHAGSPLAFGDTAVGHLALQQETTGFANTAHGAYALQQNTTGSGNTAVGNGALTANTSGYTNTATGRYALHANTTGRGNTANGGSALYHNQTGIANTANGANALEFNTSGKSNTAVGYSALLQNQIGNYNTAVGVAALAGNTAGNNNTASGYGALEANTTGDFNTAIGRGALTANTSGYTNTATGIYALSANTTGHGNTATGGWALAQNQTGYGNTALGAGALSFSTTSSGNTAVGYEALTLSTGKSNTAVGAFALLHNNTGVYNTATGWDAMKANIAGSNNTAFGFDVLATNTSGGANAAFGDSAMSGNTTGFSNTAVGSDTLAGNGNYRIALGARAGALLTTGSYDIDIGNQGVAADSGTIRLGDSSRQTTTFIAGIRGVTTVNNDAIPVLIDSAGQLGTASSSIRYKQDIEDVGALSEKLLALRPVKFRYKEQAAKGDTTPQFGLIAEEVAKVLPELVVYDKQGRPETVKYQMLAPLLLGEVQEQSKTITRQAAEIAELRGQRDADRERQGAEIAELREKLDRLARVVQATPASPPQRP